MIRIRAGIVTDPTSAPPRAAKLSMRTATAFRSQMRRNGSRRRLDGLANVVDEALDQSRIVAFGHHPDQGFGARLADDQPAAALELGLRCGDALADAVGLERLGAAVEADVLEQL